MNTSDIKVRRAIIDDKPQLVALWNSMRLPAKDLERRFTEFQVVETEDGTLLGVVGMEIIERHGRIHSEAFNDFALADVLRALLWERMQSLAANQGLARLWIAETAPFWKQNGFRGAESEELRRLPAAWVSIQVAWLTMSLRDEDALRASLEMDFDRLRQEEREKTLHLKNKARTLKYIAIGLAFIVVTAAIGFCIKLLMNLPAFRRY